MPSEKAATWRAITAFRSATSCSRNDPVSIVPGTTVTNRFDYNRDGTVSVIDQLLSRNNITTATTKLKQIAVPSSLAAIRLVPARSR